MQDARQARHKWFIPGFILLSLLIAIILHFQTTRFADTDSFYHVRHASLYLKHGPFYRPFPWVTASVISRLHADLWYGFHLALAPLTLISDSPTGVKWCGVALLTLFLYLYLSVFRRERLALPFLWPFVLLFVAPQELWRWFAVRPHLISTPLIALLLSLSCRGRLWQVALCSFAIAYIHLTLAWIVPLILIVAFLARRLSDKEWRWREFVAGIGGLALAFLLRPGPIEAARLFNIQTVFLSQIKQQGLPLAWGSEIYRLSNEELLSNYLPFLLLWISTVMFLLYMQLGRKVPVTPHRRALLWSSLFLSVFFFQISSLFSGRGIEPWASFGILFVAIVYSEYLSHPQSSLAKPVRQCLATGGTLLCLWMAGLSFAQTRGGLEQAGVEADRLKPAMEWLKAHSQPGEIVFHVNWALFPELFFWNQHNHYIGGMDPIFQYTYNPGLYWMTHRLETGKFAEFTSASAPGAPPQPVDTYTALTRDFKASYLMLIKAGTPGLYDFAQRDARFLPAYDSETVVIFKLHK